MTRAINQRCLNHADREAVARCPGCGRFFCRECVTEHLGRVLCATCVLEASAAPNLDRGSRRALLRLGQLLCGILIVWMGFWLMGRGLLALPSSFHDASLWMEDKYSTEREAP